jgi:hypothetical protein
MKNLLGLFYPNTVGLATVPRAGKLSKKEGRTNIPVLRVLCGQDKSVLIFKFFGSFVGRTNRYRHA